MNGRTHSGARCLAVASPKPDLSRQFSEKVGLWISSRGARTLLVDLTGDAANAIGREAADLARFGKSLHGDALRGYLSCHERTNLGALRFAGGIDPQIVAALSQEYTLMLFIVDEHAMVCLSGAIPDIPALVVASAEERDGISSASKMIDRMLEVKGYPQPSGFVAIGVEIQVAAKIAREWRVPLWGLSEDIENVASRVLDRAVPYRSNHRNTNNTDPDLEAKISHYDERCSDLSAKILDLIRKDPQFKDMKSAPGDKYQSERIRTKMAAAARRTIAEIDPDHLQGIKIEDVVKKVLDDSIGLGPIESLLADARVTEVMVNGEGEIYVEREGRIEPTLKSFEGRSQLMAIIERMVAGTGRRIDEASPMVDARLLDGSRINVVIPPLAIDGPAVTIRRFMKRMRSMDDAVAAGMMTQQAAEFLSSCVRARVSIVISGGTGSGKTTLLGILAEAIGCDERIITIEDAAELSLSASHVVRLEARHAGIDGTGAVTIRDLVRNALRMRPDRIVVGECRGAEALDMLQAMNTGHEGSLTTVHANSPRDALARIETMVLMAGMDLPLNSIREQIVRAVDLIVQVARDRGGSRRVVEIAELTGMEGATPCMQTLAAYSPERNALESSGLAPRFAERFKERGLSISSLSAGLR